MASSHSAAQVSRVMNPWLLHLQKLSLELKCPLCLNLFSRPILLPCNHLFCDACVLRSESCSECPLCKVQYANQEMRNVAFMENIVSIFRNLEATSLANLQVRVSQESENGETGMNREEEALMASPPSFGDVKCSDNDSSDRSLEKHQSKRMFDMTRQGVHGGSATDIGGHLEESKRQKKLNYGTLDLAAESPNHGQFFLQTENFMASNYELVTKSSLIPCGEVKQADTTAICGFCLSSKISEDTGPMLHYVNGIGIAVTGAEANCSNVIHAHSLCIDWAPQVYYEGECIKNLKAELARGSKLKCTKCGLKGAALGCKVKSCKRSYHLPCAKELSKCRWDYKNYLLLCPAHSSVKFPNEKSRKPILKTSAVQTEIAPSKPNFLKQANGEKEVLFCGSALSSEEKCLLVKFATMIGASVTKFWSPDVTHVIASTSENGACTRTLKMLMAISYGKWVLKTDWIKACIEAKQLVAEESYEISLDNHGCQNGPKTGRLRALNNEPKLFDGYSFYFVGDFISAFKKDIVNLVVAAGGRVVTSREELGRCDTEDQKEALSRRVVVYNIDSAQGSELGEEVTSLWRRINEAQDLAAEIGGQVIGHTWLLESIAACKLKPLGTDGFSS